MNHKSQFFKIINTGVIQQNCVLCGYPSEKSWCLCQSCLEELPYIEQSCATCGIPTTESVLRCGSCITELPQNNLTVSVLHYAAPVDHLIKNMKYHNQLAIADLLGNLLVEKVKVQQKELPEQIIPVPLHISRLQQRGYNQAVEIARSVGKALRLPLNLTTCVRTRVTEPQYELSHQQRESNLKNAFEIVHPIKAKHVAIIDDVMTSGSTVNELTKTLLNSGIQKVDIWACSRATLN